MKQLFFERTHLTLQFKLHLTAIRLLLCASQSR